MATQSPISTISYNTESFLVEKLRTWEKAHLIQSWTYIKHKGEDGDKDHIHLRIEPNKRLDPMDLSEKLKEYELGKDKPLGVRPWRNSKEEDWLLYAVHDRKYLEAKYSGGDKGEKLPYYDSDIVCSEGFDIEIAMIRARSYMEHTTVSLATKLRQGEKAINLIAQGENPMLVNALVHAMSNNDYQNLASDYQILKIRFDKVLDFIKDNMGLKLSFDAEGNIVVEDQIEGGQLPW